MNYKVSLVALAATAALFCAAPGCSNDDGTVPTSPGIDASTTATGIPTSGGSVVDPGAGGLYLTASAEALAVTGYDFPPTTVDDTFLVDGWIFRLDHVLVTLAHVKLWENPDTVPADQSQHGGQVAHLDGPWAVDLHKGGSLTGEGGSPEQAQPFAAIKSKDDGSKFDTTVRYAFGFDTIAASSGATMVNLDADGLADYQTMIENGYSVLYVGTVSRPANDTCAAAGGAVYDFGQMPKSLPFKLGFSTPTSYVNCQNGSQFQGVGGVNGEDHQRGIQFRSDRSVVGQVTVHADHPFWESFAEGSSLRFDQIAAQYIGVANPIATVEDMKGVDFTAFTDRNKKALPLRTCVGNSLYTPSYRAGEQLHFDPLKVPVNKTGTDPKAALRDYLDYVRYNQSTQGHLNSQGLCFVSRNFDAPPGGS